LLPTATIRLYHAAQGGDPDTEAVFSAWLAEANPGWRRAVGVGPYPHWPANRHTLQLSGHGVATADPVAAAPYSLGFMPFARAVADRLQMAALQNAAGAFLMPSRAGLALALEAALQRGFRSDFRTPLAATTPFAFAPSYLVFVLVHRDLRALPLRSATGAALTSSTPGAIKAFLAWVIDPSGGQQYVGGLAAYFPFSCRFPSARGVLPCVITPAVESLVQSINA